MADWRTQIDGILKRLDKIEGELKEIKARAIMSLVEPPEPIESEDDGNVDEK